MKIKEISCYNSDASRIVGKAEKVFLPKTVEEIQQIMKSTNLDIVPRGSGTSLVGGCVPNNSVVVDLSKMNKVSNFKFKERSVKVEAGVMIKELNEKLNQVGFEFPIKINNSIATIGGMIATNSSGDYTLKYGNIKEWIEEVEFVNGRGELMKTTKVDISEVCGMEGITGVISSVILRVIPKTKKSISLYQSDNLEEIFSVTRRLKLEREVLMIQLFPPSVSKLLGFPETYNLVIEFDSDRGKIRGKEYDELSKRKNKIFSVMFAEEYYNVEDPKFFFDKVKDFISFLDLNDIPYFSYLGVGIVHPFFKDYEKNKKNAVIDFIKKSKAKPSKFGIGSVRNELLDSFEKKIIERIKLRHDPFGKMNKGKLIDVDAHVKRLEKVSEMDVKSKVEERSRVEEGISSNTIIEKPRVDSSGDEKESARKVFEGIKKSVERQDEINQGDRKEVFEKPLPVEPKKEPLTDYKRIQDIMTNKNNVRDNVEKKDLPSRDFDNERTVPPPKKDDSDRDLINKIMTNKFKDDEDKK
jgi:FAD/FMN-containing dehydrogenase